MHTHQQHDHTNFMLGLLTGAVVGAGLAALLAPKPGRELRGDIARSAGTLRAAVADGYSSMASRASDAVAHSTRAVPESLQADEILEPLPSAGPLNTATYRL